MIAIVDYDMGNHGSIRSMLAKIGVGAVITADPAVIAEAAKLILPGVGAFDTGMAHIAERGLLGPLNAAALERKVPVLGICLGMQLLTERSEEGKRPGLGWVVGETIRFRFDQKATGLKIPHMGWNEVAVRRPDTLFRDLEPDAGFYFVHSYHVACDESEVLATAHHGYDFCCAVQKDNIFGTQFHPEKSHRYGMRVLRNFVELA